MQHRAGALVGPLRDLFAAVFFVFFSFQIDPARLIGALAPAALLAAAGTATKIATGWFAAAQAGVARPGQVRAGTTLAARGEFSIVIASLGAGLADGDRLGRRRLPADHRRRRTTRHPQRRSTRRRDATEELTHQRQHSSPPSERPRRPAAASRPPGNIRRGAHLRRAVVGPGRVRAITRGNKRNRSPSWMMYHLLENEASTGAWRGTLALVSVPREACAAAHLDEARSITAIELLADAGLSAQF